MILFSPTKNYLYINFDHIFLHETYVFEKIYLNIYSTSGQNIDSIVGFFSKKNEKNNDKMIVIDD